MQDSLLETCKKKKGADMPATEFLLMRETEKLCPHCQSSLDFFYYKIGSFCSYEMAMMPSEELGEECTNEHCITNQPQETPF